MASVRRERFGAAELAVIGQGTWKMDDAPREAAVAAIRAGLDLNLTHIDTAEMYGNGEAETLVGEAIAGRRIRKHPLGDAPAEPVTRFPDWGATVLDGETVVIRPDGKGGISVVGRIKIDGWSQRR